MAGLPKPIPVVMFTADRLAADEAVALDSACSRAAGFSAILTKPFDVDDLIRAVAGAIARSSSPSGAGA